jgi:hypothetical protein
MVCPGWRNTWKIFYKNYAVDGISISDKNDDDYGASENSF